MFCSLALVLALAGGMTSICVTTFINRSRTSKNKSRIPLLVKILLAMIVTYVIFVTSNHVLRSSIIIADTQPQPQHNCIVEEHIKDILDAPSMEVQSYSDAHGSHANVQRMMSYIDSGEAPF